MVTYTLFAIACLGAVGSFVNAFLANAQGSSAHPFHVPWVYSAAAAFLIAGYLMTREFKNVVRILLAIETIGIIAASGLRQVEDHQFLVEQLKIFLKDVAGRQL
jgi:hypothetical protein